MKGRNVFLIFLTSQSPILNGSGKLGMFFQEFKATYINARVNPKKWALLNGRP